MPNKMFRCEWNSFGEYFIFIFLWASCGTSHFMYVFECMCAYELGIEHFPILLRTFSTNHEPQHRDKTKKLNHRSACCILCACFFLDVANITSVDHIFCRCIRSMEMGTNQKSFWSAKNRLKLIEKKSSTTTTTSGTWKWKIHQKPRAER